MGDEQNGKVPLLPSFVDSTASRTDNVLTLPSPDDTHSAGYDGEVHIDDIRSFSEEAAANAPPCHDAQSAENAQTMTMPFEANRRKMHEMYRKWKRTKGVVSLWTALSIGLIFLICLSHHIHTGYAFFLSLGPIAGLIASFAFFLSLTKGENLLWVKRHATLIYLMSAAAFVLDLPNASLLWWSIHNSEDKVDADTNDPILISAVVLMLGHGVLSLLPFYTCAQVQACDISWNSTPNVAA